jgi:hypothetical protein
MKQPRVWVYLKKLDYPRLTYVAVDYDQDIQLYERVVLVVVVCFQLRNQTPVMRVDPLVEYLYVLPRNVCGINEEKVVFLTFIKDEVELRLPHNWTT